MAHRDNLTLRHKEANKVIVLQQNIISLVGSYRMSVPGSTLSKTACRQMTLGHLLFNFNCDFRFI